jgi:rhodanese-related sulfurtransferase
MEELDRRMIKNMKRKLVLIILMTLGFLMVSALQTGCPPVKDEVFRAFAKGLFSGDCQGCNGCNSEEGENGSESEGEGESASEREGEYIDVSVTEAHALWTSGIFVLDVRTSDEFTAGHIPRAYNINVTELSARIGEVQNHINEDILVYCGSGNRSRTASEYLVAQGFSKIYNMLDGFSAWKTAGYELVAGSQASGEGKSEDDVARIKDFSYTLQGFRMPLLRNRYNPSLPGARISFQPLPSTSSTQK